MNLRSKLTRRSPTLLEHLSSVTFAARIIITSVESIRFVFLLLLQGWEQGEEKSTSSMRHRWCSRLYVTCIRTVGAYPMSLEGVAIIIKLPPIVPTFQTHFPLPSPVFDSGHRLSRSKSIGTEKSLDDCFI